MTGLPPRSPIDPYLLEVQRRHDARAAAIGNFLQPGLKFAGKVLLGGVGALLCALGLWTLVSAIEWMWQHPLF